MKTTVITLISLLFMIPVIFAENDNEKTSKKEKVTVSALPAAYDIPNAERLVINLNESIREEGLPLDIKKQLDQVLAYPKDIREASNEECVLVEFTYDDDGFIHVKSTKASNEDFTDHVVQNIEKIRLRNGSVTIGKPYYAKFSFKRL